MERGMDVKWRRKARVKRRGNREEGCKVPDVADGKVGYILRGEGGWRRWKEEWM